MGNCAELDGKLQRCKSTGLLEIYDSQGDWEDDQLLFPFPEDEDSLDDTYSIPVSAVSIACQSKAQKRKNQKCSFPFTFINCNTIRRIWVCISFASCLQFIFAYSIESWYGKPFSISIVKVMCIFCLVNALALTVEGAIEVGKALKTFFLIPNEAFRMKFKIFIAKTQLELVFAHFFLLAEGINFLCCAFCTNSTTNASRIELIPESLNVLYSCFFLTLIPMVLFSFNANRHTFK